MNVEVVDDGMEAVEAWKRGGFDVILMDCQMPKLDGYGATRAIREQGAGRPSHTHPGAHGECDEGEEMKRLEAGMDGYLTKPIALTALAAAIARWHGEEAEPGAPQEIVTLRAGVRP